MARLVRPVGLPPLLVRYVLIIGSAGIVTGVVVAALTGQALDGEPLLAAIVLLTLATLAERFPLHLTHKTNVNVGLAVYIAAVLLLPVGTPALLAIIAVTAAQVLRRAEAIETLFNAGQTGLYVAAGALVYVTLRDAPLGPQIGPYASLGAIAATVAVMHLANTLLVATAGALQLNVHPLRAWRSTVLLDLPQQAGLALLGVAGALVAERLPVALPFLVIPTALMHLAVRQTIQMRQDTYDALAALVEVVELRDPYTAGHSRRVATLAREVALRLGASAQEADLVEQAGRVHDIGKAGMDRGVLHKVGPLNEAEWAMMRQHPVTGADVVARFSAYRSAVALVRGHHERWDGRGYPDGLAGEAIPLGARILAVADTFDALTSDRSYRAARSFEEALAILEDGAGTHWDPRVVAAALAVLRERAAQRYIVPALPGGAMREA